jgi:hypothetical protein
MKELMLMQQHELKDQEQYQQYSIFNKDRPQNYKPSLWQVNDKFVDNPTERFAEKTEFPFLDQAVEAYGAGPLETAAIPAGLKNFCLDFCKKFGCGPSEWAGVEDVIWNVFTHLDYTDPYFLFTDTAVQVSQEHLKYVFKLKDTGSVMPADKIESFQVMRGWDFWPYAKSKELMFHAGTQAVLAGQQIMHKTQNRPVDKSDIIMKLGDILYGRSHMFPDIVEDWIFHYYDGLRYDRRTDEAFVNSLDSISAHDWLFWQVTTVATMLWLKSPHAIPWLIDIHPVYWAVLRISDETNRAIIAPGTNGVAIAHGWDIYTLEHFDVVKVEPGTCGCCGSTVHCTKYVNVAAINADICTCQKAVDIEDVDLEEHNHSACNFYRHNNRPVKDYLCLRCLEVGLTNKTRGEHNQLGDERKCGRMSCPAFGRCKHHPGREAYVQSLTQNRLAAIPDLRSARARMAV